MAKITWLNASGGDFANGANWSGGVVPGSSDDALLTAAGTYTVTSAQNETVNSVQIIQNVTLSITGDTFDAINGTGSGTNNGVIAIGNDTEFEAGGTIAGTGTVQLNSVGNGTFFAVDAASLTLSGGGALVMGGNINNVVEGGTYTDALINVNDTISGGGQFGYGQLTFTNGAAGLVNANSGSELLLDTGSGATTNAGLIEATGTGGLYIQNTSITQSGTGTIKAVGAGVDVSLNNATITGGTLTTSTGGLIQDVNVATLDTVTINAGSTVALQNDDYLYLNNTITNKGTIDLNSVGNGTNLYANTGTVTLTGAGKVVMSDNASNQILAGTSGNKLINVNNTISGAGNFAYNSMAFDNQAAGTLDASGVNAMSVDPGNSAFSNEGLMEDTGTGGMVLNSVDVVNTGTIGAFGAGTSVQLDAAASISGGTLKTTGGGVIESVNNGTLDGATNGAIKIFTASQIADLNDQYLTLLGTIDNLGTISLDSVGNGTNLYMGSPVVTLTGGGSVVMSDNGSNQILATTAGYELVNVNNKISGSGNFAYNYMAFNNEAAGVLNSNGTVGMQIDNADNLFTNEGLIEDTGKGGITINSTVIANTGTIGAFGAGAVINLGAGAVLQGGTIETSGGGVIQSVNTGTLDGATKGAITITSGSQIVDVNDQYLYISGTIDNLGTISLDSAGNGTALIANSPTVTLTGGGDVVTTDNGNNVIEAATQGYKIVNVNNTISGSGDFAYNYLAFDNQAAGVINSNGTSGMTISNGGEPFTNEGLIEATGSGALTIYQSTIVNTGTIGAFGAGTAINLSAAGVIQGGTIATSGGGVIQSVDTGTLDGATSGAITIASGSQIGDVNDENLYLDGNIDNLGTISIESTGNGTPLIINSATVTLTGAGAVILSDNANNYVEAASSGDELINVNNTISGSGNFAYNYLVVDNQAKGVIDSSGNAGMTISNGDMAFTNEGLIEDTGAGGLTITYTIITNTGTVGAFGAGTSVDLNNGGTIRGGTVATSGGGVVQANGSGTLDGATAGALTIAKGSNVAVLNNQELYLDGSIVNQGTIAVDSTGNGTDLYIATGTVTLSGGGDVVLSDNANNYIAGTADGNTLVNVNNTISGAGQFANTYMNFINEAAGTLDANGANQLNVSPGGSAFTNAGLVEATGAGGLLIQGAAVSNSGTIAAHSGGGVTLASNDTVSNYAAGTLTGGTWSAISTSGTAATLSLGTGTISTDAAHLVLSGTNATITAGGTSVVSTLTAITAAGELDVIGGASFSATNALSVGGTIDIAGTVAETAITLAASGLIDGVNGRSALSLTGALASAGTIEASTAALLTVVAATFSNTGTAVAAGGTLHISVKPKQLAAGTLTGGTWIASGAGLLDVAVGTITADAAVLTLSGSSSVIEFASKSLTTQLASIAAKGTLNLLGGANFASTVVGGLTDSGLIALGGGTLSATSLAVAVGGTLEGGGTVTTAIADSGTVLATVSPSGSNGTLTLTGAVSGTGLIEAAASSSLVLTGGYDIGSMTVLATGTLSGGGTVTGKVTDGGVIAAGATGTLAAGSITVQPGAQLSGQTITASGAIGGSGTITLQGGTLSAASISLSAAAAVLQGSGSVAQSVANSGLIDAQSGTLTLVGGDSGGSLAAASGGSLQSDAAIAAASLTIAAGGSFIGFGSVSGATSDSGTLTASGGTLVLATDTGAGNAVIAGGATLDSTSDLKLGGGLDFAGSSATVELGVVAGNSAVISGFGSGDTIDLLNATVTSFGFNSATGVMALKDGTTQLGTLKFASGYTAGNFVLQPDGNSGTDIVYSATAASPLADVQTAAATSPAAELGAPMAATAYPSSEAAAPLLGGTTHFEAQQPSWGDFFAHGAVQ